VPVIATLATYFGERPLDIRFYDADEERLDLFDRWARVAFVANKNAHYLSASTDPEEALTGANRIILQMGPNCAIKEAKASKVVLTGSVSGVIGASLERVLVYKEVDAEVLSLQGPDVRLPLVNYHRLDWPRQLDDGERRAIPHQVLRWLRADEYMFELFKEFDQSPLKHWLNDVNAAILVNDI